MSEFLAVPFRALAPFLASFVIRALEHRVEMTNAGADDEEMVSFNDVVEWYLLSPLSVKEMPHLKDAVPGFTAALVRWIESTFGCAQGRLYSVPE
jgi:hypothetical protein